MLDLKDKKLLYELDTNARQTNAQLAKKIGLSRVAVQHRINRLQEKDIIKEFITILNHKALGFIGVRLYLKFRDVSKQHEKEVEEFLQKKVAWMVRVRGHWSFCTMIFTKSIADLEQFDHNLREQFQHNLLRAQYSTITRIYHYRRAYLIDKKQDESEYNIMGAQTKPLTIDDVDIKILDVIKNNARINNIELAQKIGVTERIVRYRLKKLIEEKIVLGFRARINLEKINKSYYKVHFTLNKQDKETIRRVREYAHTNPTIIYKTETIGGEDVEFEYQVSNTKELYEHIDNFTKEFADIIEGYEILEYDKEYKLSYLNTIE